MAARVKRINAALPGYVVHLTCDGCRDAHYVARTATEHKEEPEMEALYEVIQNAERDPRLRWYVTDDGRVLCRSCANADEQASQASSQGAVS